jgi:hypothetical protein
MSSLPTVGYGNLALPFWWDGRPACDGRGWCRVGYLTAGGARSRRRSRNPINDVKTYFEQS